MYQGYATHHFYFDFTCGNFTSGNGHIFTEGPNVKREIEEKLEDYGEKNCNVVIKSRSMHHSISASLSKGGSSTDTHKNSPDFSYAVTSRWHNYLIGGVFHSAPIVLPLLIRASNSGILKN